MHHKVHFLQSDALPTELKSPIDKILSLQDLYKLVIVALYFGAELHAKPGAKNPFLRIIHNPDPGALLRTLPTSTHEKRLRKRDIHP